MFCFFHWCTVALQCGVSFCYKRLRTIDCLKLFANNTLSKININEKVKLKDQPSISKTSRYPDRTGLMNSGQYIGATSTVASEISMGDFLAVDHIDH